MPPAPIFCSAIILRAAGSAAPEEAGTPMGAEDEAVDGAGGALLVDWDCVDGAGAARLVD